MVFTENPDKPGSRHPVPRTLLYYAFVSWKKREGKGDDSL